MLKIHKSYRWVVAVCDEETFGKKLIDPQKEDEENIGNRRTIDVSGVFFKGTLMSKEDATKEIERCAKEDSTFNFVGENSVEIAKKLELVDEDGVTKIDGIPFALVLM